ncbi:MAG: hypothetical protein K0U12_02000 [Gammaproteobacteria bacterium]|nr:hypothetical protein [Gammaproteobacteria bacterium]
MRDAVNQMLKFYDTKISSSFNNKLDVALREAIENFKQQSNETQDLSVADSILKSTDAWGTYCNLLGKMAEGVEAQSESKAPHSAAAAAAERSCEVLNEYFLNYYEDTPKDVFWLFNEIRQFVDLSLDLVQAIEKNRWPKEAIDRTIKILRDDAAVFKQSILSFQDESKALANGFKDLLDRLMRLLPNQNTTDSLASAGLFASQAGVVGTDARAADHVARPGDF